MKNLGKHVSSHDSFMYLWILGAVFVFGGLIWSYIAAHPRGVIDGQHEGDVRSTVAAFGNQLNAVSLLSPDAPDQIRAAYGPYVSEELLATWMQEPESAPGRKTSSPWPDHIEIESVTENETGGYDVAGHIALVASTGDAGSVPVSLTVENTEKGYRITKYGEDVKASEPTEGSVTLALNETESLLGVSVTPLSVEEDSRCPMDAMCIQEGTVRVSTRITSGMGESVMTLTLGTPATTEAETVTLIDARPYPMASNPTEPEQYRFTYRIEKR